MIIDCIADLHGHYPELEGGDLLIVAGDLTARDTPRQLDEFCEWLCDQKYTQKIVIPGNHDNQLHSMLINQQLHEELREYFWHGTLLCDSGTEFEGLKIWGSPWTSQFPGINPKCCAFTRPFMTSLKDRWDLIPDDTDILVTHGPPNGIFDKVATEYGAHVGDVDLRDAIDKVMPEVVIFGHIHEHGGKYVKEKGIFYVNGSIVDEKYRRVNSGTRIFFDEKMPKMQRFKIIK